MMNNLLGLLQLASPVLPVGAYSYSEGLETLVGSGAIANRESLADWIKQELSYGAIRLEAAIMVRAYHCCSQGDQFGLSRWNNWISAVKETEELRLQSAQMGNTLMRLLIDLDLPIKAIAQGIGKPCHYPIAYAIGASIWQINCKDALLSYLHTWTTNLITAGIKLIPLGQTVGQQILLELHSDINNATQIIIKLADEDLHSCTWGLALASMEHETLYTRLFRS